MSYIAYIFLRRLKTIFDVNIEGVTLGPCDDE